MFARLLIPLVALVVSAPLVLAPAWAQDAPAAASTEEGAQFSKEQLDQLLAPIALYPDDLLTNVLTASTYPLEVVQAARWVKEPANAKLKGDALATALEKQDWDPSVKSLVQSPEVLEMMSAQLEWMQKLGDAMLAQESEVLAEVQVLRGKAEETGSLKSNDEQKVTTKSEGGERIVYIEPANPEVVYVPYYRPAVVYGPWWYPAYPPYYWPPPAGGAFVSGFFWGVSFAVVPRLWGWGRCDWRGGYVNVNVYKYNRINVNRAKINSNRWQHNSYHRRGVRYNNPKVRNQYGRGGPKGGQQARLDHRGYGPGKGPGGKGPDGKRPGAKGPGGKDFKGKGPGGKGPSAKGPSNKRPSAKSPSRKSSTKNVKRRSSSSKSRSSSAFSNSRGRSSAHRQASRGRSSMGRSRGGGRRGGGGHRGGGRRR